MKKLNPKIIDRLSKELSISEKTIRNNVGDISKRYPNSTLNARAYLYAEKKGLNLYNLLDNEDKKSLPSATTPILYKDASTTKPSKVIVQIGNNPDRFYNKWWVQLLVAIFVGILAGAIAQVLGIYIAIKLGITK
jgi:hypothetical protein